VGANRRLLGGFLDEVARGPAVLVGNSMGGYLALAEAAAEPAKVSSLVLVDPAVPLARGGGFDARVTALFAALALPVVGELLMHLRNRSPERAVRDLLGLCCVDPSLVADHVLAAHLALARERASYGRVVAHDFLVAQRSLVARLVRPRRFFAMVASIPCPALIVQGDRDRLVRVANTRALAAARPDWQLEVFPGVGHVPQLEAAERFVATVGAWLERQPRA
jgi:pimeloyl-ACP methyl ester carboxylesterase